MIYLDRNVVSVIKFKRDEYKRINLEANTVSKEAVIADIISLCDFILNNGTDYYKKNKKTNKEEK